MTRLALNKASLARESKRLKIYQRYLPSLDLKRRQLIAERFKAKQVLEHTRHELEQIRSRASRDLPMLANETMDLAGLARITDVAIEDENLLGTVLPKLTAVAVTVRNYSTLATPHWIDPLTQYLKQVLEIRVRAQVEGERLARLEQAVRTVTQRVNLFDRCSFRERASVSSASPSTYPMPSGPPWCVPRLREQSLLKKLSLEYRGAAQGHPVRSEPRFALVVSAGIPQQ